MNNGRAHRVCSRFLSVAITRVAPAEVKVVGAVDGPGLDSGRAIGTYGAVLPDSDSFSKSRTKCSAKEIAPLGVP